MWQKVMEFRDDSGIGRTIYKQSEPRSKQVTMPTLYHSVIMARCSPGRQPNQQRQTTESTGSPGNIAVKSLCVVSMGFKTHQEHLSCRLPSWTPRLQSRSETHEETQRQVLLARSPRPVPLCRLPAINSDTHVMTAWNLLPVISVTFLRQL